MSAGGLPVDPALAELVLRARRDLQEVDPLGARLLGESVIGLPVVGEARDGDDRSRLRRLLRALEAAGLAADADDEADRESLIYGLRRATPADGPRVPAGAVLLEQHLLASLPGLASDPAGEVEGVARLVEDGPAFLAQSREATLGGPAPSGEVALAAAKRLPVLLTCSPRPRANLTSATWRGSGWRPA